MRDAIRITEVKGGWRLVRRCNSTGVRVFKTIAPEEMPEHLRPAMKGGKYLPYPTEKDAEGAARALVDVWYPAFVPEDEE